MNSEEIFDRVKEIIIEQLGVSETAVSTEASFIDDRSRFFRHSRINNGIRRRI